MTTTHPQNRVPQWVFDRIVTVIRREQLDGPDLHDIAASVGEGEPDYFSCGLELWLFLRAATEKFDVSAEFLISEACICLDWPVTS